MRMHIVATMNQRSGWRYWLAVVIAAVPALLAVLHLFKYEELSGALMLYMPGLTSASANILAALIVTAEVFAIAYFLPLLLSKLARALSALLAMATPLVWVYVYAQGYMEWNDEEVSIPELLGVPVGMFLMLHALLLVAVAIVLISDKQNSRHAK